MANAPELMSTAQILGEINGHLPGDRHIPYWTLMRVLKTLELPRLANRVVCPRDQVPQIVDALKAYGALPEELEITL